MKYFEALGLKVAEMSPSVGVRPSWLFLNCAETQPCMCATCQSNNRLSHFRCFDKGSPQGERRGF